MNYLWSQNSAERCAGRKPPSNNTSQSDGSSVAFKYSSCEDQMKECTHGWDCTPTKAFSGQLLLLNWNRITQFVPLWFCFLLLCYQGEKAWQQVLHTTTRWVFVIFIRKTTLKKGSKFLSLNLGRQVEALLFLQTLCIRMRPRSRTESQLEDRFTVTPEAAGSHNLQTPHQLLFLPLLLWPSSLCRHILLLSKAEGTCPPHTLAFDFCCSVPSRVQDKRTTSLAYDSLFRSLFIPCVLCEELPEVGFPSGCSWPPSFPPFLHSSRPSPVPLLPPFPSPFHLIPLRFLGLNYSL